MHKSRNVHFYITATQTSVPDSKIDPVCLSGLWRDRRVLAGIWWALKKEKEILDDTGMLWSGRARQNERNVELDSDRKKALSLVSLKMPHPY